MTRLLQDASVHHEYSRWALYVSWLLLELCGPLSPSTAPQPLQGDVETLLQQLEGDKIITYKEHSIIADADRVKCALKYFEN